MRRWLPHVGIALGLVIAVYALFFAETEEDRIRAQLDALEEAVEVVGRENPVLRGARVKKAFETIFVEEVRYEIPELAGGEEGRAQLVRLATAAPRRYEEAAVDLSGLRIEVGEAERSAVAHGEAVLSGTLLTGEPKMDRRVVSIRLDRIEDAWRIVSLSVSLPSGSKR